MFLGTPTNINGRDGLVLFDPMTHTLNGNSGIGDFGLEGINAFIRDHQCSEICKCLHLDENVPLRPIEEGEDENGTTRAEEMGTIGKDKGLEDGDGDQSSATDSSDEDI